MPVAGKKLSILVKTLQAGIWKPYRMPSFSYLKNVWLVSSDGMWKVQVPLHHCGAVGWQQASPEPRQFLGCVSGLRVPRGSFAGFDSFGAPQLENCPIQVKNSCVWAPQFHFQGVRPSSLFAASPPCLANLPGTGTVPSTTSAVTGALRVGNCFTEKLLTALLLVLLFSSQRTIPSCFPCCHQCKEGYSFILLCHVFLLAIVCFWELNAKSISGKGRLSLY